MKAEHRHELHTNVLADRMGRLVDGIKNPSSTTSVVAWVIGGLAVVAVIAWYWSVSGAANTSAMQWAKLEGETFDEPPEYFAESNESRVLENLAAIAPNDRHSVPGRTARFQEARYLLPMGLKLLGTLAREDGVDSLKRARTRYVELARECGDNQLLAQEAWLGAGRAEEGLIGAPDPKDPEQFLGSAEKAKEYYRKARDLNAASYLGREAATHYDQLDKDPNGVVKFYVELAKNAAPRKFPRENPAPTFPPVPGGAPGSK